MIRGKRTIIMAIAVLTLSSSNIVFANESVKNNINDTENVQVREVKSVTAYSQSVGVINAVAQPESEDGMKLPNMRFATEQNAKFPYTNGGYNKPYWNTISGDLYVKYGDSKLGYHTYGSKNQMEYDKVVGHVKNSLRGINFRLSSDWVYLQYHLNGGRDDNYIDPILGKNNINVSYETWRVNNKHLITGLQKGIVSRADAEQLMLYAGAVEHVACETNEGKPSGSGEEYSAFDRIVNSVSDCDGNAQFKLIIADIIGVNGMVAGGQNHQDVMVQIGNYWWVNGIQPTLNKTTNPFDKLLVIEAPTYNLEAYYNK